MSDEEAYKTWNSGTAMMLVVNETDAQKIADALNTYDAEIEAKIVGEIDNSGSIKLLSKYSESEITF